MQTVMITGGTGFIGKALTSYLVEKGFSVIVLTRNLPPEHANPLINYALWNIDEKKIDIAALQKTDHIIHLAGAPVMEKRWTPNYMKEIQESRTKTSSLLVEAMQQNPNKVKTVIS